MKLTKILEMYHDFRNFEKLFPHIFRSGSADFHYKVHEAMDKNPRELAVAIARGFGKSTSFTFGQVMRRICYREEKFIVVLAKDQNLAEKLISSVRYEVKHNKELQKLYNISIPKGWTNTKQEIHIKTGEGNDDFVVVKSLGFGQDIRGLNVRNWRPTLIILDDYTSSEKARISALTRQRIEDAYYYAIKPAIDPEFGKIWTIGTIVHEDDLLSKLLRDKSIPNFFFPALKTINGEEVSIWEEFRPTKDILLEKERAMRERSTYTIWLCENMLEPSASGNAPFKDIRFGLYSTKDLKEDKTLKVYTAMDYAPTVSSTSDYTVITSVAINSEGKRYVLRIDYIKDDLKKIQDGFVRENMIIETMFKHITQYKPRKVGIETRQGANNFADKLIALRRERRVWFEVEKLTEKNMKVEAKNDRIMFYLNPPFMDGKYFFPDYQPKWYWDFLAMEIENFAPDKDNKHDDALDTLVMIEHLIDKYGKGSNFGLQYHDNEIELDDTVLNPYVF